MHETVKIDSKDIIMKKSIFQKIKETIGSLSPETGGIIGICDNIICEFYFDNTAYSNADCYIPNDVVINEVLEEWALNNVQFYGIVHSHPYGQTKLSYNDIIYARQILDLISNTYASIYFPIIQSEFDGKPFEVYSYVIKKMKSEYKVFSVNLTII